MSRVFRLRAFATGLTIVSAVPVTESIDETLLLALLEGLVQGLLVFFGRPAP